MDDRADPSDSEPASARARGLKPRQLQCLELVAQGYSTKEIAGQLGIEPGTVDTYIAAGVKALGARGRYQAAELLRDDARNRGSQNLALSKPPPHSLDMLPYRRKGVIGNDLPILSRLFWIFVLSFGFAIAFGMFAIGARVVSDFVRALAG